MEDTKKLAQARRRRVRRLRFTAGLRDAALHHRAKLLVLLAYLLTVTWVWRNRGTFPFSFPKDGLSGMIFERCFSFAILVVCVTLFVEIIIALGMPRGASIIQNDLAEAGFSNAKGMPPLLLSVYKGVHEHSF